MSEAAHVPNPASAGAAGAIPPYVSVIVPVFNDAEHLQKCLEAIKKQTYAADRYEILLIENGSAHTIDALAAHVPNARVLLEERPGSYAARNAGIRASHGEILAFTDADCVPASDWLERGVAALLAHPRCGLLAGRINVFPADADHPTTVELYDSVRGLRQKIYVEEQGFGATANLFIFRRVLDEVGFFDDRLKSCGDVEWGWRVASSGYALVYCDEACVDHPARRNLSELARKMRRVAGGLRDLKSTGTDDRRGMDVRAFGESIAEIWRDPRTDNWRDRLKVLSVMLFVEAVKLGERVRLLLGGKSQR